MPNKQLKLRWTAENDADVLVRKLLSGEKLVDGEQITGEEAPSDIYHLFERF